MGVYHSRRLPLLWHGEDSMSFRDSPDGKQLECIACGKLYPRGEWRGTKADLDLKEYDMSLSQIPNVKMASCPKCKTVRAIL